MIDFTKPVRTVAGDQVRILATDISCPYYPVLAAVKRSSGSGLEDVVRYTEEGKLTFTRVPVRCDNLRDLENVPERLVRYLNVYSDGFVGYSYDSAEDAVTQAMARSTGV